MLDGSVGSYDIIHDSHGRFVLACPQPNCVKVLASRDGYRWVQIGQVPAVARASLGSVSLLQRRDERYELLLSQWFAGTPKTGKRKDYTLVVRHTSSDGRTWSKGQILGRLRGSQELAGIHAKGRSSLLACSYGSLSLASYLTVFVERPDGDWRKSGPIPGMIFGRPAGAFHPRWGCLIAWSAPRGHEWFPHESFVPYLMRGPGLGSVLDSGPQPTTSSKTMTSKG